MNQFILFFGSTVPTSHCRFARSPAFSPGSVFSIQTRPSESRPGPCGRAYTYPRTARRVGTGRFDLPHELRTAYICRKVGTLVQKRSQLILGATSPAVIFSEPPDDAQYRPYCFAGAHLVLIDLFRASLHSAD